MITKDPITAQTRRYTAFQAPLYLRTSWRYINLVLLLLLLLLLLLRNIVSFDVSYKVCDGVFSKWRLPLI